MVLGLLTLLTALAPADLDPLKLLKWDKEIVAIEKRLAEKPPAEGAVVFLGSSSIRLWDTAKAFPKLATANAGFGGSTLPDTTQYLDRLLKSVTKPRAFVLYAGDNDLAGGRPPARVRDDFKALGEALDKLHPGVPLLFIAIKPSGARWAMYAKQTEANTLVKDEIAKVKHWRYVDVVPGMLGADGQPTPDLFVADKLHLSAKGYDLWVKLVDEELAKLPAP